MSTPESRPAPRVWWDGYSLLILCPDGEEMPALCRGRTLRDIELSELPIVELERRGGFTWRRCAVCEVPIFRHEAWSHEGGTPPTDHDADPGDY